MELRHTSPHSLNDQILTNYTTRAASQLSDANSWNCEFIEWKCAEISSRTFVATADDNRLRYFSVKGRVREKEIAQYKKRKQLGIFVCFFVYNNLPATGIQTEKNERTNERKKTMQRNSFENYQQNKSKSKAKERNYRHKSESTTTSASILILSSRPRLCVRFDVKRNCHR